jgi:Flp pilus assembly protein TadB
LNALQNGLRASAALLAPVPFIFLYALSNQKD